MTKKDYVSLARALASAKPQGNDPESVRLDAWRAAVQNVACALKSDNARFNRDTFYAACGMD